MGQGLEDLVLHGPSGLHHNRRSFPLSLSACLSYFGFTLEVAGRGQGDSAWQHLFRQKVITFQGGCLGTINGDISESMCECASGRSTEMLS